MRPCFGVNFTAFIIRFQTICRRRSGSPETGPTCGSKAVSTRMSFASAAGVTVAMASCTTSGNSTACMFNRILPETTRETSRMSSTICVSAAEFLSIVSNVRWYLSAVSMPPRSIRA